jgi:hypothetical protein
MSIGCASLRPPAEDKAAWNQQQKEEAQKNSPTPDPFLSLLYEFWPGSGSTPAQ